MMPYDPALDRHAWESCGGDSTEFVDPTGLSTRPEPWKAFADHVNARPRSVFVCPPEWEMTSRRLRFLCSEARPSRNEQIATGLTTLSALFSACLVAAGASHGSTPFVIVTSFVTLMFGGLRYAVARIRRENVATLAALDLTRVVEATNPSGHLQNLASMDMEELTFDLVAPPRNALAEVMALTMVDRFAELNEADAHVLAIDAPPSLSGRWATARDRFEVVESEWEDLVCNPVASLKHAALLDVERPLTARFVYDFAHAKDILARHRVAPSTEKALSEFEDAARRAAIAWTEAKRHAAHIATNALPEDERTMGRTALKALMLAMDESAPIGERANAARTAAKVLDRIHSVVLKPPALDVIEDIKRLAITA